LTPRVAAAWQRLGCRLAAVCAPSGYSVRLQRPATASSPAGEPPRG